MDSYDLNDGHKIRYWFGGPDVNKVLKSVRKFIKENEVDNVSSLNVDMHWDDEAGSRRYEATLVYGGF